MNFGELEDGVSAEEQLLEVLSYNTLDRADNKDNADNVRLIIFPCDNDECQTLEELEAQKNSHLVEFGTEEADSCLPCKRRFKYADDLMDHIKWYHKTCPENVKHRVMCALCRQMERIWQQRT